MLRKKQKDYLQRKKSFDSENKTLLKYKPNLTKEHFELTSLLKTSNLSKCPGILFNHLQNFSPNKLPILNMRPENL